MPDEFLVDLQRPPAERWVLTDALSDEARQLADMYINDLGVPEDTATILGDMARSVMPDNYWQELEAIAGRLGVPTASIFVCNAYYDLVKSVLGCTAFSVETVDGPIHARNLDWWTQNRLLNDTSFACRFVGAPAGEFVTIGWPGFTGALSGMAPGRFCITLNAVLSHEPMQIALPVSYMLRSAFEQAKTFDAAVDMLCNTTIPSECLLLVSGTKAGERVVIERSPTRHAIRRPEPDGGIAVANEYLLLDDHFGQSSNSELQKTSEGRYGRITELLSDPPKRLDACLEYLSDPSVQMTITVQQMAFCPQSGQYTWRKL